MSYDVAEHLPQRTFTGRVLRGTLWVFTNTVGYVIALLVFFVAVVNLEGGAFWSERVYFDGPVWFELIVRGSGSVFEGSGVAEVCVLCAIVFGITYSAMQWLVLVDQVPTWWIVSSTAGYAIVIAIVGSPYHVTRTGILFAMHIVRMDTWAGMTAAMTGAFAGAIAGAMQWLALRRRFSRAGWWVLANAIGWGTSHGMVAAVLSNPFGTSDAAAIAQALLFPLTLVSQGLVIGAITGFTLFWLLGRRETSNVPDPFTHGAE